MQANGNLAVEYAKLNLWDSAAMQHREVLQVDPENPASLHDLGVALQRQGKIPEAIEQYRETVRIYPRWATPHYSLGLTLANLGRSHEARTELEEALRCDPQLALAHQRLGRLLVADNRLNEAVPHLRAAIEGGMVDPMVNYDLARILSTRREFREAIELLRSAVFLQPRNANMRCLMAYAMQEAGYRAAAAGQYQEATRINPSWPEALNQEAWMLATHPDSKRRDGDQAIQLARQVCQASDDGDPRFLDTLAAAYAEKGDFARASAVAEQALAKAAASRQERLVQEVRERLRLYAKGRPFRSAG
jgi:Flp pilus assembly protein TadD